MKKALRFSFWTTLLLMMTQGAFGQLTWTGADPSGYWSAPANWSPAGVPVNGADLVFPGGLPPEDKVSTNDLTDSIFRSIRFDQAGGHTIRGNPITLTNRTSVIIHSGTNVIACDLTFSGTPSTPQFRTILGSGELTVIGNVGGGSLYFSAFGMRLVIRGQFTGGSLLVGRGTVALYGDNPYAVSAQVRGGSSRLLVQGSQPNLNVSLLVDIEDLSGGSLSGDGLVGDVTGHSSITPDSTLSVRNVSVSSLNIHLNGTNVGAYGRLVASGDVSVSGGFLYPSAGFNPQEGQVYTIVEKTSPGLVANAFLGPEGTVATLNGMPFRISYVGGDGNDVTLTAMAPPPTVTVAGSDATAFESGDIGMYTITRTGSTASSLLINYTLSGTAQNGTDYNSLSGSVTILAGANSATVSVVPTDDTAVEGNETVTLTLAANSAYTIGSPNSATVTIADNDPPTTPPTITWTGADPSGNWSAPANWSPAGVPVSGADLVFPGGLPPEDTVSTNDLTDSIFRSITFGGASRHTIRGNPITLTNRAECIINSGTNVIACDLTFSGTPPTPDFQSPTIRDSFGSGELTVIGNVGGGSLSFFRQQFGTQARWVIRGQFTGGSLRVGYSTLALYGDNPNAISAVVDHSTLLVQGSQPNLNIRMFSIPPKTLLSSSLRGEGQVGDVTGGTSYLFLDSTLAARNVSVTYLSIILNGTNVGQYGRLVASGNVSASSGFVSASAGFNPQEGQVYTIVEKTSPGPVTSAFFGPEGSVATLNGMPFRISYVGGDGNDVTLTATDTPPTVTITNPPNGAVFDAPASFTLGAAAADPGGSVTNVQFFLDATSLGNDTSSPYSVPVSGLVVGTYTLTAVASDDAGTHATNSIAITVQPNMPPTVSIISPTNGAILAAPFGGTIRATASDGTIARVDFFSAAGAALGSVSNAPFNVVVTNIAAGTHALFAVATDNGGATNRSATVTVTVVNPVPIVLGDIQRFGTQFVFSYSANVGLNYRVERSATGSSWTALRSNVANVNPMTVTDFATNRMNFYRVMRFPNP